MTQINNTLLNNTNLTDYNLFLIIKKNLIQGEIIISHLTSKNRALLHRVCGAYGLEHYSTGNYSNRVFIIKDNNHTYFNNNDYVILNENSNNNSMDTDNVSFSNHYNNTNVNEKRKLRI